jgi:hypothetical protein
MDKTKYGYGTTEFEAHDYYADYYGVFEGGKKAAEQINKLVSSFDTGGYTGSWGSEGKVAMLHEKELVLNADDTENLLNTIGIIR